MKNRKITKRLENGLFYTDSEILILYRESKDKLIELKILSEMNLCPICEIKKSLKRAGFDLRRLPKAAKNKKINNINT